MIYAGRFIPTATAGAQPTGDEATAIPFLKRFSPIPSTVKICDRYPEHLAVKPRAGGGTAAHEGV
jgi:hypothetical protein